MSRNCSRRGRGALPALVPVVPVVPAPCWFCLRKMPGVGGHSSEAIFRRSTEKKGDEESRDDANGKRKIKREGKRLVCL